MGEQGTKECGARRSGGAKLRCTVLGTCCLRLKIAPVVTGMVERSQHINVAAIGHSYTLRL